MVFHDPGGVLFMHAPSRYAGSVMQQGACKRERGSLQEGLLSGAGGAGALLLASGAVTAMKKHLCSPAAGRCLHGGAGELAAGG